MPYINNWRVRNLALAFALTPGAELVRGRVFRAKRDEQWKVVFERNNPLQDSPALRVMFEVCAFYVLSAALHTLLTLSPGWVDEAFMEAALLTLMIVGIGIAMTALLLYIQVYTSRGCFRLGMALLLVGFVVPPMLIWAGSFAVDTIKPEHLFLVSPLMYIGNLNELHRVGTDYQCPVICAILAAAFCVLAGLRIRFLLDIEDIVRKRAPAPRDPTLQERMNPAAAAVPLHPSPIVAEPIPEAEA